MKSFGRHEEQPQASTSTSTLVLVLMIPLLRPFSASAAHFDNTSFNFPSFESESLKLLSFQRNASVLSPYLHLSLCQPNQSLNGTSGRATYSEKVHLWDKASGNEADFSTQFMFSIDCQHRNACGDGLTFFVAPWGLSMPGGLEGGQLGLPNDSYLAVEVDTFKNTWDADTPHLGIDLNDLRSMANVTLSWLTNKIMNGGLLNASLEYDSQATNLSIVLMDAENSINSASLHYAPLSLSKFLPEWVEVGFSAATGAAFEYHIVHSWEFNSILMLQEEKFTLSWWIWLIIAVFCVIVISAILFVVWLCCKAKIAHPHPSYDPTEENNAPRTPERKVTIEDLTAIFEKLSGPKKYSFEELRDATNSFAEDTILGNGGFGTVYKGQIEDSPTLVAVKVINSGSRQGIEEYISEVKSVSQLSHRNLVPLMGYCHEENKFCLVYEFMQHGSLGDHLFENSTLLTWERRYEVARGLALGLHYLHRECKQCVIHRDIKSDNIMLNEKFEVKLGDFGLARPVDHTRGQKTTQLKGTPGYLAPECYETGKVSKESDVYSFGVVLLEIVCGRKVIQDRVNLVDWVRKQYGQGRLLPVDPKLGRNFDKKQAEALIIAGLWCAHRDVSRRPTIEEAMAVLKLDFSKVPSDLRPSPWKVWWRRLFRFWENASL